MAAVTTLPWSGPLTRADKLAERDLPTAPLLAVEILSPSTRHFDLMLKRSRFEAAGCPSYRVVDPDVPELIAWELRDGAYVEAARVRGVEEYAARQPYPVTVRPDDLLIG